MRVGRKVLLGDRVAYGVGRDHALAILGMVFEIFTQQEQDHGRALAVARDDKRTPPVAVLEVVVQGGGYIVVGHTGKRRVDVPGLLMDFPRVPQAGLAIVRHKHVGSIREGGRMHHVLACHALQHLLIVQRRVIGGSLFEAPHDVLRGVNVDRVDLPGSIRNLIPAGLPGVVGHTIACF